MDEDILSALDAELGAEPEIVCEFLRWDLRQASSPPKPCGEPAVHLMACMACKDPVWEPICDRCKLQVKQMWLAFTCKRCNASGRYADMKRFQPLWKRTTEK